MRKKGGKALSAARGGPRQALCALLAALVCCAPAINASAAEADTPADATNVVSPENETAEQPALFTLDNSFVAVDERQPALPDNITADSFEISEDGRISASGGVHISINSVVQGGTLEVSAEHIDYDLQSGAALLSGEVLLTLAGSALSLRCDSLDYDPTLETLHITGLHVAVPLAEIFDPAQLAPPAPEPRFDGHFYGQMPQSAYLIVEDADLSLDDDSRAFVLRHVRLSHSGRPDPDLYVKAREVRLENNERVVFKDIALYLSGIKVFAWPRLTRGLVSEERNFSFNFPVVRIDRDVGVSWKQSMDLSYQELRAEALLDYSAEYGMLTHTFIFLEPVSGARIGVAAGTRTSVDADRRTVERRESFNFVYEQDFGELKEVYRDLDLRVEYGELASAQRFQGPGGAVPIPVEDTRMFVEGDIDFPLVQLGPNLYFAAGALYRYVDYADADETYQVFGGRSGFVLRQGNFDHFIMLSNNQTAGIPVLRFDELRKRELSFATSIRLHPEWRHVIRGSYDLAGDEFDILEVGAMKRQKSYEIGLYWDFARDNAGFEFGLLMD